MNLPDKLKLFFDGSCMPINPGGVAGFGWQLLDMSDNQLKSDHGEVCRGPTATNNIAEYAALKNCLKYLKEQAWQGELEIYGDSQLVIRQLTGQYKCRKETLIPYYNECLSILKEWKWSAKWIPREENAACDTLSRV